jgi:hypothetical protein
MSDPYSGMQDDLLGPSSHLAAIVPSDSAVLPTYSKGLYVGGAGDVTLIATNDGAALTFKAVPAGTTLRVRVKQVMATGTTATYLVALL